MASFFVIQLMGAYYRSHDSVTASNDIMFDVASAHAAGMFVDLTNSSRL